MTAVRDASGIAHHAHSAPQAFATMFGGMPGQTACRKKFFLDALGPSSCSWPGAVPMDEVDDPVDCMSCLVVEARRGRAW